MMFTNCNTMQKSIIKNSDKYIHGYVVEGFEVVKKEFIKNFTERDELGAACAIYYKGEKVVDLWGGFKDTNDSFIYTVKT